MATRMPRPVQEQLKAAEKLEAQLKAEVEAPAPAPLPPLEQVLATPEPAPEPTPTPALVAAPAQAPAPTPAPTPPQPDPWEHKYRVLQGQFNKLVPDLQGQVKQLSAQIEKLQKQPEPAPQKPQADAKDIEDFGKELVEMVSRNAQRHIDAALGTLGRRIDALEALAVELQQGVQVTSKQIAMTAEDIFWQTLADEVSDYETINQSPAFLQWLAVVDKVYRKPRQHALDQACDSLDAKAAAAVFKAFKEEQAPQPASVALTETVSPLSSSGGGAPPVQQKPVIYASQITAFYERQRRGHYRNNPAEMNRLEAEINSAVQEGRVIDDTGAR